MLTLQPSLANHPIVAYITPDAFEQWRQTDLDMGFNQAACDPFVRSSYHAETDSQGLNKRK